MYLLFLVVKNYLAVKFLRSAPIGDGKVMSILLIPNEKYGIYQFGTGLYFINIFGELL